MSSTATASVPSSKLSYLASETRTHERLRRVFRKTCPAMLRSQIDDLTQKAILRLLERDQKVGQQQSYCGSYLHRTAYCVLIDELRRARRTSELHGVQGEEQELEGVTSSEPSQRSPEEQLFDLEMSRAVQDCISQLKEDYRVAAVLQMQGHRYDEIASALECDRKRISNLLFRGREMLRACLRQKGFASA